MHLLRPSRSPFNGPSVKFRAWLISSQRLMCALLSANQGDSLHRTTRATLEVEEFVERAQRADLEHTYIKTMSIDGRHQRLTNYCLPPDAPAVRDNIETAVRAVLTFHHSYANGFPDENGFTDGTTRRNLLGTRSSLGICSEFSWKVACARNSPSPSLVVVVGPSLPSLTLVFPKSN